MKEAYEYRNIRHQIFFYIDAILTSKYKERIRMNTGGTIMSKALREKGIVERRCMVFGRPNMLRNIHEIG